MVFSSGDECGARREVVHFEQHQRLRCRKVAFYNEPSLRVEHFRDSCLGERAAREARRRRPHARLLRVHGRKRADGMQQMGGHLVPGQCSGERRLVDDKPLRVTVRKKYCRANSATLVGI